MAEALETGGNFRARGIIMTCRPQLSYRRRACRPGLAQESEEPEAPAARDRLRLGQEVAREGDAAAGGRTVEAAAILRKAQPAALEIVVEIDAEGKAAWL